MPPKTHTGSSLYFIALIPPDDIEQDLHQIKLDLNQRFQYKAALKSPAHITLIPPFSWPNHSSLEIIDHFIQFKSPIEKLSITIDGFDRFGTQVIYAKPKVDDDIFTLQNCILQYFTPILKDKMKYKYNFNPHFTVANRDVKAEEISQILEELANKNYLKQTIIDKIALLKHNGTKWKTASEIYF